jgi:NADH-quinone oxidoreductase subunit G
MPCKAKKFAAARGEHGVNGKPDTDVVLTTEELARMMKESGIEYEKLEYDSFDMPFGFATGAAVIFGTSGGVSEAVLRFAAETLEHDPSREYKQLRGNDSLKTGEIEIGGKTLKLAIVSGLANTKKLIDKIRSGEEYYDLVEVMACPGGCVNGGGQPVHYEHDVNAERAKGLYNNDRMLQFHSSGENPHLQKIYQGGLDEHAAHALLHSGFENRRRIAQGDFVLNSAKGDKKLSLSICFGTSCFLRGAQDLYNKITAYIQEKGIADQVEFKANFCGKKCKKGPVLEVNATLIEACTFEKAVAAIQAALK